MSSERFSAEKDKRLIELVSGYPMLWNMAHNEWKNQFKKDLAWIEIGRRMEKTNSQCKLRWKSIRDHYRKQRKQEKGMPAGSAAAKKRAAYWDRLQFLDTVEDERRTFSNAHTQDIETPVNLEDLDEPPESQQLNTSPQPPLSQAHPPLPSSQTLPACSATESLDSFCKPPVKKEKLSREKSVLKELVAERRHDRENLQTHLGKLMENEPEDENDLFFKTVARTVKKFKPALITQAKKRIFAIVMDLEEENQQPSNNYGGNPKDGYYNDPSSASSSAQASSASSSVHSSSASSSVHSSSASSVRSTQFQQYPTDEPKT